MTNKFLIIFTFMIVHLPFLGAQSFHLFAPEVKQEYPSVIYDFLERYLYELDSLQKEGINIQQKISDDKVFFFQGFVNSAKDITPNMEFTITTNEGKSYEVSWLDSIGNIILGLHFPMQYELILGKPKNIIEIELKSEIMKSSNIVTQNHNDCDFELHENGYYISQNNSHYYLEELNTTTYYIKDSIGAYLPIFDNSDKFLSAANLFQGQIKNISKYQLSIKQNLYGFKYDYFTIPLEKWIGYCGEMKMITYFAIEDELKDGIKALIIAQSPDLGFNHILSLIIPNDFIDNQHCIFNATLNAYVPTQNIKDLYQLYVNKPKKKL